MSGSGCGWLKMKASELEMSGSGWEQVGVDGGGWKWMGVGEVDGSGWK